MNKKVKSIYDELEISILFLQFEVSKLPSKILHTIFFKVKFQLVIALVAAKPGFL